MRMAAYGLAVSRVAEATTTRGLYPVAVVLYYGAQGCHLCERARETVVGAPGRARLRAGRGRHRRRPGSGGALPRVAARSSRSTASGRSSTSCHLTHCAAGSHKRTSKRDLVTPGRKSGCRNGKNPCVVLQAPPQEPADRTADGRCRGPAEPVPPGADPGEEDGQGPDLLAGDLGLHEHQRHPDPPRPVGVREVRQARGRLQHRQSARRDPQDPADTGPAQHRARRGGAPGRGDRRARRSSPSTGSTSRPSSTPTPRRSAARSATSTSATTAS